MATKIRQSNLDNSVVTGLTELNTGASTTDQVIVYDASAGTLKKISQTNLLNFPSITSVSPTNVLSGDGTGNHTIIINGTGFTGAGPQPAAARLRSCFSQYSFQLLSLKP